MRKRKTFLVLTLFAFLFAGCGSSNMALKPEFWKANTQRVGVAFAAVPHADVFLSQRGGIIDMVIDELTWRDLSNHLNLDLDTTSFYGLQDTFMIRLAACGMNVVRIEDRLVSTDFKEFHRSPSKYYNMDVRPIAAKDSVDVLLLLVVPNWGVMVKKGPLGFSSEPKGFCTIKGYVIDLADNSLEWKAVFPGTDYEVEVDDEWNQPPDYPTITRIVKQAAAEAKARLIRDFFEEKK